LAPSDEAREIGEVCDFTVVPGLIYGLRAWTLYTEGSHWRLGSRSQASIWPVGEPMEARCAGQDLLDEEHPHDPPGPTCGCGIYAYHPFGARAEELAECIEAPEPGRANAIGWTVYGVIAAWGRVEVHEQGFRAQSARLAAILTAGAWDHSAYGDARRAVALEYDVPVVPVLGDPEEVVASCRERWPGLTPELVDTLLMDEREVVLLPGAHAQILGDGQTLAGSGYLVEEEHYDPWFWDAEWALEHEHVRIVRVVGTKHTGEAMRSDAFAPLQAVELVPEPDNASDPHAVAIYDAARVQRVGYVPKTIAAEIQADLKAGKLGQSIINWQWRDLDTGERAGLCVLIPRRRLPVHIGDLPTRSGRARRTRRHRRLLRGSRAR
jgi:hypothetical protein